MRELRAWLTLKSSIVGAKSARKSRESVALGRIASISLCSFGEGLIIRISGVMAPGDGGGGIDTMIRPGFIHFRHSASFKSCS